jgi:hypothetical protein
MNIPTTKRRLRNLKIWFPPAFGPEWEDVTGEIVFSWIRVPEYPDPSNKFYELQLVFSNMTIGRLSGDKLVVDDPNFSVQFDNVYGKWLMRIMRRH